MIRTIFILIAFQLSFAQEYWQQHVEYEMNINVDVSDFTYDGDQSIVYTNNSNDTINKVYYHLFFNAFKPNSQMDIRSRTIRDPDRRVGSRIVALDENDYGDISVSSLKQDGKDINFEINETVLLARLNKPLLPGKKTKLNMVFTAQIPLQIRRSGKLNKEGVDMTMTQWFPKLAEFDPEGWHPNPYIGREFHGVWGNYKVNITIDKNYVVGGTGYLQNANEIGHGYSEKIAKEKDESTNTWKFYAPNVHDFAWAADPDYIHDIKRTESGVDLHFFYKPTVNVEHWKKLQDDSVKLMEYFEESIGPYPWEQYSIIQGGDGGMEYAMCTMITGERPYPSLLGVTAHEMAHAWFQHLLATNEAKHSWMDEGFTEYVTSLSENYVNDKDPEFPHKSSYDRYYLLASSGFEQAQTIHSDRYDYNFAYGASAYSKGSVFLSQLGYIIGKNNLNKTLKRYYEEFKFKHPTPNDFKRIAEKVSDLELEWYLNEWTRTPHKVDYGIDISLLESDRVITLKRIGRIPMPIEIVVSFEDGSSDMYYIPNDLLYGYKSFNDEVYLMEPWNWVSKEYEFEVVGSKKITKVEIDPSKRIADVNQLDNSVEID
ncbi:MAG: M1 family metallopeptidase [Flavobacteriaceae bacterium]|mgnify:FL=1